MSSHLESKVCNCFLISFLSDAFSLEELDNTNFTVRLIALSAFILVLPSVENTDARRFSHLIAGMARYFTSDS